MRFVFRSARLWASASRQPSISFKESRVNLSRAALRLVRFGVLVEGTFQNRIAREDRSDVVPFVEVILVNDVLNAACCRAVLKKRLAPAVVNRELLEVGEDRKGELRAPGVAPQLIGRARVVLDIDRGFLSFDEELARAADSEAVIGRLGVAADLDRVLVNDLLVSFGVALLVVNVPAEKREKGIDEFLPNLRFVVT